ncbi:MAG: cohesin domain-containing protein, partial [candidate division Zixibacteria bacterium]|nr:cohesin domain-containing protein [candidate division Zixibacteria bacterium]
IGIKAVDTLPPPVPSDFTVLAGNQKCRLSWNNPAVDPTFMGVEIRRNPWHTDAYPEYDDIYPVPLGYPANKNEGTLVYRGNAENFVDSIINPRNVYYYSIFSYDSSGNYSSPDTGRALNYWLGDVTYDGQVYFEDLVIFAETFGEVAGESNYVAEFDIGPTYDMTPAGIPTTDNSIDFEDLVIFALNYMEVGNQKIVGRELARTASGELGLSLNLSAEKIKLGSTFDVSISLVNNPDTVKSIHFVVPYDSSELEFVSISRSYELIDSSYTLFFYGKDVEHKVDVSLAVLGGSTPITGSGEIAVITFKLVKNVNPNLAFSLVDLRDGSGNTLDAEENYEYTEIGTLPGTYGLNQNFPNPFNPVTTIPFSLKTRDLNSSGYIPASLKIYNIKGQLVKTLFEEEKLAGDYSIIWDGKDTSGNEVASGIYFYRLKALDYSETKKMILLR